MNRTLKLQLGKLCQETYLQWDQLLPIALLRIRSSPTKWTGLSPFEVLYRYPPPQSRVYKGITKKSQENLEATDADPWFDSLENK
jgi:hypothetical protein